MNNKTLTTIGIDADDTLWQNEHFFRLAEEEIAQILSPYATPEDIEREYNIAHYKNIHIYGYGVKCFTLCMLDAALVLSNNNLPASITKAIIDVGKEMLAHPVILLPGVKQTIEQLQGDYRIILITKGDLLHQEQKLAASLLGDLFNAVEIVSEKTTQTYQTLFTHHDGNPERCMMVGNSLKSDIIPALDAGCWGVHIPHEQTWVLEQAPRPVGQPKFHELDEISKLPDLVRALY